MKRPPDPTETRLEVIMFSGDSVCFGPFELVRALFHRYMLIQYGLAVFILTLIDTRSTISTSGLNEQAAIVLLAVTAVILLLAACALTLDLIARKIGTIRYKTSPILFVVTLAGVIIGDITEMALVGNSPRWERTFVLGVYYYIILETIAHMLMLLVMPRVLSDFRERKAKQRPVEAQPQQPDEAQVAPENITIGGRRIKADSLVRIEAEGNYLQVFTDDERLYLPGPFGEVVDPLPETLGVKVSRSDWVAIKAAWAIRRDGREMFVDLKDGTAVRVANSRQKVVLAVLDLPVERVGMDAEDQGAGSADGSIRSAQTG